MDQLSKSLDNEPEGERESDPPDPQMFQNDCVSFWALNSPHKSWRSMSDLSLICKKLGRSRGRRKLLISGIL